MLTLPSDFLNKAYSSLRFLDRAAKGIKQDTYTICREDGSGMEVIILSPEGQEAPLPCLVYYHGGGFRLGMPPNLMRRLSRYVLDANCIVVSPDYRLSGEHPFPAGFNDCRDTLDWTVENSEMLGIDVNRIAVGGDSAGGNFAAATSLSARDGNGPDILFQMLIYPALDHKLESKIITRMWDIYLKDGFHDMETYASPLYAESFENLPSAYIEVGERDHLYSDAIAYSKKLRRAGVKVETRILGHARHGYDNFQGYGPVKSLVDKRIQALRKALAGDDHGK